MPKVSVTIMCESDVTIDPADVGSPPESLANARAWLDWIKATYDNDKGAFLSDYDMTFDMDITVSMVRVGDENPDQMTLDGAPAILPPQHSAAHWG